MKTITNAAEETMKDLRKWCPVFFGCDYDELGNPYWKELLFSHTRHINQISDNKEIDDYIEEMTHPKWLSVPGYYAEILSNATAIRNSTTGREYSVTRKPDGYWVSRLQLKDGDSNTVGLHRAMALACIPNDDPVNKTQVNHIDGFKGNNLLWNLEWVTAQCNIQHAIRTGLKSVTGENNGNSRFTNEQIRHVCQLLQDQPDLSFKEIAKEAGVTKAMVGLIYRRKEWQTISKDYVFPPRETIVTYSDEQVRNLCKLLSDPNYSAQTFPQLEKLTGIDRYNISKIYQGLTRTDVSKDFKFVPRDTQVRGESNGRTVYTEEQAEEVCNILDDIISGKYKMSHQQIADKVGVSKQMVDAISAGLNWTYVAKNHIFYKTKFNNKEGG